MTDTRGRKVKRYFKKLQRKSKKLSIKTTLFKWRLMVVIFLQNLLPTITYKSLRKIDFDTYYDSHINVRKLIRFGYSVKKAEKCFERLNIEKIDTFGIDNIVMNAIRKEGALLLAETEALINPKKRTRYLRKKEDYEKKTIEPKSKKEIAAYLSDYFKEINIDLKKISAYSVLQAFETMKNGNRE